MGTHHIRRLSENLYWKMIMNPGAVADATYPTSYIDVSEFGRGAFLLAIGATDDTAITMQVKQATDTAGTGSKDVTGAAITGTVLAGANDNKWALIELDFDHLDLSNDFDCVAVAVAATGGAASQGVAFFFGLEPRIQPPTFGSDKAEIVLVDG
jgi:hypothetical protein